MFIYGNIYPLKRIFFYHLLGLFEMYVLDPPTLIGDLIQAFLAMFARRSFFIISLRYAKVIAQNCTKTKRPSKKIIKSTLKYMDRGSFFTYKLWSGCWDNAHNFAAKFVKLCGFFLNFWKKKSLWRKFKNQISERTAFLHFPLALSWYALFFFVGSV